jgi:hypothetical protein
LLWSFLLDNLLWSLGEVSLSQTERHASSSQRKRGCCVHLCGDLNHCASSSRVRCRPLAGQAKRPSPLSVTGPGPLVSQPKPGRCWLAFCAKAERPEPHSVSQPFACTTSCHGLSAHRLRGRLAQLLTQSGRLLWGAATQE